MNEVWLGRVGLVGDKEHTAAVVLAKNAPGRGERKRMDELN